MQYQVIYEGILTHHYESSCHIIWNATDSVPKVGLPYFMIVPLHSELVNIILQKWEEYNC